MTKVVGYRVSSSKHPAGKFYKNYSEAYSAMDKEMKKGARESGISEVFSHPPIIIARKRRKLKEMS